MAACSGSINDGVQINDLPANVSENCPHPSDVIRRPLPAGVDPYSVGADEIRMGRLGDELIKCGAEKQIAVGAFQQLTEILK